MFACRSISSAFLRLLLCCTISNYLFYLGIKLSQVFLIYAMKDSTRKQCRLYILTSMSSFLVLFSNLETNYQYSNKSKYFIAICMKALKDFFRKIMKATS